MRTRLFPALLKYHRGRRGISQLELATEAEVSARHVSFLESGRARPTTDMVLRLLSVLGASLREQNEALLAAGLEPQFPEPPAPALAPEVDAAIRQMMQQHEPFPLAVLALDGTVLDANQAARAMFRTFAVNPAALTEPLNAFALFFDPELWRPFVVDWERVAHAMLARVHRESLSRNDLRLSALVDRLLGFPGVPPAWRRPDLSTAFGPMVTFRLKRPELEVGFLVAITTFAAPRDVTLDELRLESCFPVDENTRQTCHRFAQERGERLVLRSPARAVPAR